MAKINFESVDDYIASQPADVQGILTSVRIAIREAIAAAMEIISYNMPTYTLHGARLLYFAVWKKELIRHGQFTEATSAYVGAEYERNGSDCRLLFLSLDPGSDDPSGDELPGSFPGFRDAQDEQAVRSDARGNEEGGH